MFTLHRFVEITQHKSASHATQKKNQLSAAQLTLATLPV
jgi:hypothetical protein